MQWIILKSDWAINYWNNVLAYLLRLGNQVKLNSHMVTLTERAKEYLKSVSNGNFVTLSVKGGGCSGFQYEWGLTDKPLSDPIDDVLSC